MLFPELFRRTVFVLLALFALSIAANSQMRMHVINVGQAESIILEFPRHAVLVDAGSHQAAAKTHLFSYIDGFFAGRPDLNGTFHSVVVSHPHPDHTTNLKAVFERYRVMNLVEGGGEANAAVRAVRGMLAQEGAAHHPIMADEVKRASFLRGWRKELKDGSQADVRFLSAGRSCNNPNNASLVMRVEYKGRTFLLLGDAEEDDVLNGRVGCGGLLYRLLDPSASYPELLDVDVYKAAHHGAKNGTIALLLARATPIYAVISAGDNTTLQTASSFSAWDHGHPNKATVDNLRKRVTGTREAKTVTVMNGQETKPIPTLMKKGVYSTGWDGDIIFSVDAAGNLAPPTLVGL